MPSIRAQLAKLDPLVPAAQVSDMNTVIANSVADRRMLLSLIGAFGAIAVVLATIGIYGVLDYMVLQRRREIGVRMAFGATRNAVLSLVVNQGMRMGLVGVGVGLVIAAGLGSIMASVLYEVSPRDVPIYAGAAGLLLVAVVLGSLLPAARASRVDPNEALRAG
jgi:ABC-type antimicrobial peptide transport system permease subunit